MLFLNIIIFIFKNTNKYIIDICGQWKNLKTERPYFVFSAANYYSLCITRAVIKSYLVIDFQGGIAKERVSRF